MAALVVLLAPAAAQAAPSCPPSAVMDDVHSGASQTTQVTCDDTSGTGLTWTTSIFDDAQHGVVQYDQAGTVTYFPDPDYKGSDSWTTVVDDNEGGSTTISFSVEVVNEVPVCNPVTIDTTRNQSGYALPDCDDPDGDLITIHVNPAENGTSGLDSGYLTYSPDTDFAGSDQFTYYATDGVEASATANVDVTVQNNTPTCDGDLSPPTPASGRTGKAIKVVVACFDLDGDPIDVEAVSGPDHGTLSEFSQSAGGYYYEADYTPDDGYLGADQLSITADDGIATSAPMDFDLTVTENHAPQCDETGAVHAKVDQKVSVFVFCSDEDDNDQDLAYSVVSGSGPNHGTLGTLEDFQVDYTPASGYTGEDSFAIQASDGELDDTYEQVLHVADTPVCSTPPPVTVRSGRSRQLSVDCTVPDDDFGPYQYQVVTAPSQGTLNPSGTSSSGFRTYTAGGSASGSDSYAIRLTTSASGSSPAVTQAITTGTAANNAPTCDTPFAQTVYSGRPAQLFIFCSDVDGDELSFSAGAAPAHGTSSTVDDHVEYTAGAAYTGHDEVPFTASDGHGGSTNGTWPVEVHAPEAPSCGPSTVTLTVRPGTSRDLQLFCSNPQGDDQTYSVSGPGPAKGSLGDFAENGVVTYTADENASGTDSFQLKATNEVGDSAAKQVTITIDPDFNRAPQCNGFATRRVATGVSSPQNLASLCTDPDGDPMLFVRMSNPAHGTVTAGPAAALDYQSVDGYLGPDSFTFVARDDRDAESGVVTRFLDVVTSAAPTCTVPSTLTLRPGQSRQVGFSCTDPNSEQLTYMIVAAPTGSLNPAGDSTSALRQYTAPGTAGPDNFTFKVRNASGLESPVYTQNVSVDPSANRPPTCGANSGFPQNVARNHATVARLTDTCFDPDGDPLTFTRSLATNPQHGTTAEADGAITYTSAGTYLGDDSFSYVADDGHGGTAPGTFSVTVLAASAPTCDDVSTSTMAGAPVEVDLVCTDADSGDTLTLSAGGASHGSLGAVDEDTHKVTFTPAAGYVGSASFTYQATDDTDIDSDPATVSIDVQSNEPSCSNVAASTSAGTSVQVDLSCTDPDSGDTLTLSAGGASHGTLGAVDQGTKKVTFTPEAGYVGSAGFSYHATDSHGVDSDPATATITVNAAPGDGDPGGGDPGGGPAPDGTPPTLGLAPLPKQKLATVLRKGLGVTVSCSEACVANLKLTIAKALAKKLGLASADVTLGSARKTLAAGRTKVYVKLSAKARKRLKRARSVKVKLVLTAKDAAGNPASTSRSLTLKR